MKYTINELIASLEEAISQLSDKVESQDRIIRMLADKVGIDATEFE